MEKVFQTKSGTALYFNLRENTYYTSNLKDVKEALMQDLSSGILLDVVNALNILAIINSFIRVNTLN